jgi:hypothetical protein
MGFKAVPFQEIEFSRRLFSPADLSPANLLKEATA